MSRANPHPSAPLRVFCLEDNPLIVFHLEQMIEDLGHVFAGALESFDDLLNRAPAIEMDCALVDIDLADGATGPAAAAWLSARGIPSVFVTGQEAIAAQHPDICVGIVPKPITDAALAEALALLRDTARKAG